MERNNVKTLIKLFEIFEKEYSLKTLLVAVYIYIRYDYKTFRNEINKKKLSKIGEKIMQQDTLFKEELNYSIDSILNNEE